MPTISEALATAVRHHRGGRLQPAEQIYRRILQADPNQPDALHLLGVMAHQLGKNEIAVDYIARAIALKGNVADFHNNLADVYLSLRRMHEAVACGRRAVELQPDFPEAHNNLGNAFKAQDQLDDALASYRRAVELNPNLGATWDNLGSVLKETASLDESIACYRRAMALEPRNHVFHSNLVATLHLHPAYDKASIRKELGRWNRQFAKPSAKSHQTHANARDPERRLLIGYVSPNLWDHVVGRNVLPVLERHDHARFQVFCYAGVGRPDAVTQRFQAASDVWRDIASASDQAVAELIRADGIDILIDLALHTEGQRLMVFARKPAPVQITWAGYPGATGLDAIDYRLTDPYLDPPEASGDDAAEEPIRLPDSFWCYDPLIAAPPVNPLPAQSAGCVTFGSLNTYCKVNEGVIALWSQVLDAVQGSRLLLLSKEGMHRARTLRDFERHGITADRIDWLTPAARREYLAAYHRIDLGLDTVPYNGHTTSLESAWMGVPVVTLVGSTIVGRAGLSQLMNLGLQELIATTPEQYVQIAAGLAQDLARLARLRATLRDRMQASPLMDAPRFTRNIEAAYRKIWQDWCAK